jgi:hypothetical protein
VTASKVLEALHDNEDTQERGPERLLMPLRGAAPHWFGGKLRGVDDFKHYSTAVIIGRLEQSPATINRLARCLFADGSSRLDLAEANGATEDGAAEQGPTGGHCFEDRPIQLTGGRRPHLVRTRTYPDRQRQAVEAQLREAATSHAIARLRLILPTGLKRVVVLSSVPIQSLRVTQLLRWRQLRHPRLRAALAETGWRGLRLSAAGLAEDAPATFRSGRRPRPGCGASAEQTHFPPLSGRWPPIRLPSVASGSGEGAGA